LCLETILFDGSRPWPKCIWTRISGKRRRRPRSCNLPAIEDAIELGVYVVQSKAVM
jgi:hypothetical protein